LTNRAAKSRKDDSPHASLVELVAAALQISSHTQLESFQHRRLSGRPEFKLRVGDYRILGEFDLKAGRIYLYQVGHRREIYK
jgi:mRNA-degrading endonuclease RelE of RelBE toxin-antitoxin system